MNKYKGYLSILIFIGLFILLKVCKIEVFSDLFDLTENQNISTYLSTIIGSIASFSGLLIAIILAAYEFYRSKSGAYLLQYFWTNPYIQLLISFNISTLIISGLTLLELKGNAPEDSIEVSLCYYSIIMFFSLIPITIISFWKIAETLSIDCISDDLLSKMDLENDPYVKKDSISNRIGETPKIESIKNSPVYNLAKLISFSYLRNEEETANRITNEFTEKFIEFYFSKDIKPEATKHWDVQYFLGDFYLKIITEAQTNPTLKIDALQNVLGNIVYLYSTLNKRKLNLTLLRGLRHSFFQRAFDFYLKSAHRNIKQ